MSHVTTVRHGSWTSTPTYGVHSSAVTSLETGDVLFLPDLRFEVSPTERELFSPAIVGNVKNVSFSARVGRLGGTTLKGRDATTLRELMERFSSLATTLVGELLPVYRGRLEAGRASFRPVEIAGRVTSWRKDDTRLHIDSFPASPVQGKRILRVFTNVNPAGQARVWRIGEEFETVARRFSPELRMPLPGSAALLQLLRITKTRRTVYDELMLQLHDRMKADTEYQARAPQTSFEFPSDTTWMAFTDQVSHAAMAGQYQLEQTLLLPVEAMLDERRSPLRVLERVTGRALI